MNEKLQHDILAYHVTPKACVSSILSRGIIPQIGPRSALAREPRPAVYLFAARVSCEDALANWLGEQFDLAGDELVILQVAVSAGTAVERGAGYEVAVLEKVPPSSIFAVFNSDWSALGLHCDSQGELARISRKESDMPFLMTRPVALIEPRGSATLPEDWEGLCVSGSDVSSYWYLGRENNERSFHKLFANTYHDAVCELAHRKITSSKKLRMRFPARGSMPRRSVELLYALRDAEVNLLGNQQEIRPADFGHLDWGARITLVNDHFEKCCESARDALLHDEHHFVRSEAAIAMGLLHQRGTLD